MNICVSVYHWYNITMCHSWDELIVHKLVLWPLLCRHDSQAQYVVSNWYSNCYCKRSDLFQRSVRIEHLYYLDRRIRRDILSFLQYNLTFYKFGEIEIRSKRIFQNRGLLLNIVIIIISKSALCTTLEKFCKCFTQFYDATDGPLVAF